jgi:hypothetical protein
MRIDRAGDWQSIIEAGIQAPSADNYHHLRFRPSSSTISIITSTVASQNSFYRRILNCISLGSVIENMIIRAARLGYHADIRCLSGSPMPPAILELQLAPGGDSKAPLDAAIARRHTNRNLVFRGPPLDNVELARFHKLIADISGVKLTFIDSGWRLRKLLYLVWRAESERFGVEGLHHDLFAAIRFDLGWNESAEEGLPLGALGIERPMRAAFVALRHWPFMRVLNFMGANFSIGFRSGCLPCLLAPHHGVLTADAALDKGRALASGRALQRLWLYAESLGLALQPLAAAALLSIDGYEGVSPGVSKLLRGEWRKLTNETPLMVFRMGRAQRPTIRTERRDWTSYLSE